MYNILIFDDITMNFSIVYMTNNLKVAIAMYNYYRKKYEDSYIKVMQELQSNDYLISDLTESGV